MSSSTNGTRKGLRFWLIFTTMCICLFLSAFELSSISTALPTIANDFHSAQFTWVGTAFALASTAFLPMSGGLAQTFGRRPAMLVTLGLFALGSTICGTASSMNMLIAGRAVQGLGGGGIQSLTGIILADLVTLQERGVYAGLYGITWCIAASIGPVVGGSLAAKGQWRWLFYLNLPISLLASLSVIFLLDLPTPPGSYRDKFKRMDWVGNFLIISSTTAITLGLTWGGITYPWGSANVFMQLILGVVCLVVFIAYEAALAEHPLMPLSLMTNITSASGYIQTFCCFVVIFGVVYYFPVYYQGCKGASPSQSGIDLLAISALAPAAVTAGLSVKVSGVYRLQTWIGWAFMLAGLGVMSTLTATDSLVKSFVALVVLGLGIGTLSSTSMYPIQAPLPVTQNARALAFMWFLRSFASVWGITAGSTVLQNELAKNLPTSFVQSVPQGTAIMYALIPELSALPAEALPKVQVAFAQSLVLLWQVMMLVAGVGFITSFVMKGIPLHTAIDEDWALNDLEVDVMKEEENVG